MLGHSRVDRTLHMNLAGYPKPGCPEYGGTLERFLDGVGPLQDMLNIKINPYLWVPHIFMMILVELVEDKKGGR